MKKTLLISGILIISFGLLSLSCKKDKKVDTTIPVITINGANPITVAKDSVYSDLGASASDDKDGDISANIIVNSNVNIHSIGDYTVKYNVSDAAGNKATEVTRVVKVRVL